MSEESTARSRRPMSIARTTRAAVSAARLLPWFEGKGWRTFDSQVSRAVSLRTTPSEDPVKYKLTTHRMIFVALAGCVRDVSLTVPVCRGKRIDASNIRAGNWARLSSGPHERVVSGNDFSNFDGRVQIAGESKPRSARFCFWSPVVDLGRRRHRGTCIEGW